MAPDLKRSSLSPGCRRLLDLLRQVDFGFIDNLTVANGQPVLDPPPRFVRVIKLKDGARARTKRDVSDFVLKEQIIQLLACMQEIGDGTINRIEVQDGLPFKVVIEGIGDRPSPIV